MKKVVGKIEKIASGDRGKVKIIGGDGGLHFGLREAVGGDEGENKNERQKSNAKQGVTDFETILIEKIL